jgi:hypothetical protein
MTLMSEQTKAPVLDPKDIARAELARWRHRLGPLTHEQLQGIENLVMSTAIKISLLGGSFMDSLVAGSVTQFSSK